ncbi:DUF2846 domain-containing protein [Azospirillaceae bacterium]
MMTHFPRSLLSSFALGVGAIGFGLIGLFSDVSPASANDSSYTSLKDKDCVQISAEGGGAISECPARNGFRIFAAADDARSWMIVQKGAVKVDLYDTFARYAPGDFPALAGTPLEWRYGRSNNQPIALIFRISGNDPRTDKTKTTLLVMRVSSDSQGRLKICALGATTSNNESRAMADGPQNCN